MRSQRTGKAREELAVIIRATAEALSRIFVHYLSEDECLSLTSKHPVDQNTLTMEGGCCQDLQFVVQEGCAIRLQKTAGTSFPP